jgi:hypothetical protein
MQWPQDVVAYEKLQNYGRLEFCNNRFVNLVVKVNREH